MSRHGSVGRDGMPGGEDPTDAEALSIEVRRGAPSADELAAAIAVITETYAQEAADAVADDERRDAWSIAARGLRTPLRRELGWRSSGA